MDREIAKRLMGWKEPQAVPDYTRDIGLAMEVFDRMRELGHRWLINADEVGFHLRHVACVRHDLEENEKSYTVDRPLGTGKTLKEFAKVICEAALRELEGAHQSTK